MHLTNPRLPRSMQLEMWIKFEDMLRLHKLQKISQLGLQRN